MCLHQQTVGHIAVVAYSRPLALNMRMVVATTVQETPTARGSICLALKVVVMLYLLMSRVFFTLFLLRAIHVSFRLRVSEGERSSTIVEGLERARVPTVPAKVAFFARGMLSLTGRLMRLCPTSRRQGDRARRVRSIHPGSAHPLTPLSRKTCHWN
jgi:hypothetical protein